METRQRKCLLKLTSLRLKCLFIGLEFKKFKKSFNLKVTGRTWPGPGEFTLIKFFLNISLRRTDDKHIENMINWDFQKS